MTTHENRPSPFPSPYHKPVTPVPLPTTNNTTTILWSSIHLLVGLLYHIQVYPFLRNILTHILACFIQSFVDPKRLSKRSYGMFILISSPHISNNEYRIHNLTPSVDLRWDPNIQVFTNQCTLPSIGLLPTVACSVLSSFVALIPTVFIRPVFPTSQFGWAISVLVMSNQ